MDASKTTWRHKAVSLLMAFILMFGLSPFGATTPAYADPASNADENVLSVPTENGTLGDVGASNEKGELNVGAASDGGQTLIAADQEKAASPAAAEGANALEGQDASANDDAATQPKVTIKGLHSAQINSGKLYTFTDGVRGETDLLANTSTTADGYSLMYDKVELAAGDYWFEAFDSDGNDNGGLKVTVTNAEEQTITVHRVYDLRATNSGWVRGTDYQISVLVKGADGADRLSTVGDTNAYGTPTASAIYLDGDTVEATFTPLGEKAETNVPITIKKNSSQTTTNVGMTASIPVGIDVNVTAPAGSTVSLGDYSSYIYTFYDAAATTADEAGNVVASFRIPGSAAGQRFVRVQNPDGVTYWSFDQITSSKDITVSAEDIHLNDSTFTKSTVNRFTENVYDMGNIYMNINSKGYLNMEAGQTYELNMFRNWQAIESFMNSKIALPDMHYQVVDFNGNASDVVSIVPDENNSNLATMKAEHAGTAVVKVTYDAMIDTTAQGGSKLSAIWPELTGVFVVSVGADGSSIETNMLMDRAGSTATKLDSEHDTLYYLGDQGATYTFTPEAGCTVSIARSTVDGALTFTGFTTEGVSVDEATGAVTVSQLTTGRHIIKVEKDGVASYQIINARQASLTITDAQGATLSENSQVKAGDVLTLQFSNLLNPCEKLATLYNRNTVISYTGTDGTAFASAPGGNFGVYDFSSNADRQRLSVTIPKYWDESSYTLSTGVLRSNGFGSQPGDHRGLRYLTGKAANLNAEKVGGVLSSLPNVTFDVAPTEFITGKLVFQNEDGTAIDRANVNIELKDADGNIREVAADGTFTGFAEDFSYTTFAAGYMYQTGSVTLSADGSNVFTVTLEKSSENAWDGKTTTEPQKDENGTYLISTGNEMAWFALQNQNKVSATGKLTADIDLAGYPWLSSGTSSTYTTTVLDGAGHKVTNLNATNGLFGSFGNGSSVKNLSVYGQVAGGKDTRGGIVGFARGTDTVIENCASYVTFAENTQRAGGVVGNLSDATVKNCANYGAVTGGSEVGGVAGYVNGSAKIIGCVNNGTVTGGSYTGGVFGSCEGTATISNCYNTGAVSGTSFAGGIGGKYSGPSWGSGTASLNDCYNTGAVTTSASDKTASGAFGTFLSDKATAERVYYLEGTAETDPIAEKLTAAELQEPEITLSDDGFGLTCNGYPRLHWENADFHNMGTATSVVAPTCTEKGYSTYTCDKCNKTVKANYVAALGHDFCGHETDNPECADCVYTAPTCTQAGSVVQTCRRDGCSETNTVVIPATGHTEDPAQTVVKDGYRTCVCSVCGESFNMGSGTILGYVELPLQGIQAVSESLDETYTWAYNADTKRIESQNVGKDSTTAKASMTFKFDVDTAISFNYGVSSEKGFDKFNIKQTVDGNTTTVVSDLSGEDAGTFSASFAAGKEYTFAFEFYKDGGSADGQDKAWFSHVKIADVSIPAESVSLDAADLALGVNETATLVATVLPDNATNKTVTWTSDNEDVATVADGVVTAKAAGVAHITATTANGKTATCDVMVMDASQRGDANGNGRVNIVDAQVIYDLSKGVYGADYASFKLPSGWGMSALRWVANVNGDDAIDAADAFAVQYFTHYGSYGA